MVAPEMMLITIMTHWGKKKEKYKQKWNRVLQSDRERERERKKRVQVFHNNYFCVKSQALQWTNNNIIHSIGNVVGCALCSTILISLVCTGDYNKINNHFDFDFEAHFYAVNTAHTSLSLLLRIYYANHMAIKCSLS